MIPVVGSTASAGTCPTPRDPTSFPVPVAGSIVRRLPADASVPKSVPMPGAAAAGGTNTATIRIANPILVPVLICIALSLRGDAHRSLTLSMPFDSLCTGERIRDRHAHDRSGNRLPKEATRSDGDRQNGSRREAGRLEHSLGLDDVILLVDHDDPIRVHQAVRDERQNRRRDRDAIEVETSRGFHQRQETSLLIEEVADDPRIDRASRREEFLSRLRLATRVGAEDPDEHRTEQSRQERHALPEALLLLPLTDVLDDREVRAVRDDQMVEALTDAPFACTRLPVDLLRRQVGEHPLRLIREGPSLAEHVRQVAPLEIAVHAG